MLMAVASVALLVKGLALSPKVKTPLTTGKGGQDTPADLPMRPHWLAAGLLALLVVYLVALPWLGYILSIGFLSAAVGWFAGGRERKTLLGFALLTGPILWFLFDFALKVHMPAGFWPKLFTG
jgi:hypothetical protein